MWSDRSRVQCSTAFDDGHMPVGKARSVPKTHMEQKLSVLCIIFTSFFAKSGRCLLCQMELLEFLNSKSDYSCDLT